MIFGIKIKYYNFHLNEKYIRFTAKNVNQLTHDYSTLIICLKFQSKTFGRKDFVIQSGSKLRLQSNTVIHPKENIYSPHNFLIFFDKKEIQVAGWKSKRKI